mmetsp:Transcript_52357/g.109224  ORF Transcript_52357/g.109224 Transcript_52357/m.109224 type:complete len:85 (-) Transcript_52357:11-265(-)
MKEATFHRRSSNRLCASRQQNASTTTIQHNPTNEYLQYTLNHFRPPKFKLWSFFLFYTSCLSNNWQAFTFCSVKLSFHMDVING